MSLDLDSEQKHVGQELYPKIFSRKQLTVTNDQNFRAIIENLRHFAVICRL